jgi:hypothetical protein
MIKRKMGWKIRGKKSSGTMASIAISVHHTDDTQQTYDRLC